jgi:hypothetical protein
MGEGRSGTTMLDLMLGSSDEAFSVGEVYALYRPWRTYHYQLKCSCGRDLCEIWEAMKKAPEERFHDELSKFTGMEFIVDSSKDLNWIIDNNTWALRHQFRVFNVLIYKQPLDSYYSFWKRNVAYWKWVYGYASYHWRLFQSHIPFISISFDQLLENPEGVLKSLCGLLKMTYTENQEKFWEFDHHLISGSAGTRQQLSQDSRFREKDYEEPFQSQFNQHDRRISGSRILPSIVKKLIKHDFKNHKDLKFESIRKPPWYFYYAIKSKYKRIFPDKWQPPSQP